MEMAIEFHPGQDWLNLQTKGLVTNYGRGGYNEWIFLK